MSTRNGRFNKQLAISRPEVSQEENLYNGEEISADGFRGKEFTKSMKEILKKKIRF